MHETRGKKPFITPTMRKRVHLSEPLVAKVELLLLDPLKEKPRYGAFSHLVEELLADWLKKQITVEPKENLNGNPDH